MVWNTLLAAVLSCSRSPLLLAFVVARRIGEPIRRLTDTTHEIAAGNFGERLRGGPGRGRDRRPGRATSTA